MKEADILKWRHSHAFGQEVKRDGEFRTKLVIALTVSMMVAEIAAGIAFGSMALLADGIHMASHTVALTINAVAYVYARRHAHDTRFCFGTGKVNALGGYTGAILLAAFALMMAWESIHRLIWPTNIAFNWAIAVAVLGLVVNGVSVVILGGHHHHHAHGHDHDDDDDEHHDDRHEHEALHHRHDCHTHHDEHCEHHHGHAHHDEHAHVHGHEHEHEHEHEHDHNLRSAYLHVLADALTSITAIIALLAAKYAGWLWMDPLMGIVGSLLVARWSLGLLRQSGAVLLDRQAPQVKLKQVREAIEAAPGVEIADLHVWSIGPDIYSVAATVVADQPVLPDALKARLDADTFVHVTIEVQQPAYAK